MDENHQEAHRYFSIASSKGAHLEACLFFRIARKHIAASPLPPLKVRVCIMLIGQIIKKHNASGRIGCLEVLHHPFFLFYFQ